jgi:hypothetical protein
VVLVRLKSRKIYWLWGIFLTVLAGAGIFCWAVVVPCLHARTVVRGFGLSDNKAAIEDLGGSCAACRKLRLYYRTPFSAEDHLGIAILLGYCGSEAVPILVEMLQADDSHINRMATDGGAYLLCDYASDSLARIGKPAVRKLIETLDDSKRSYYAARALGKIGFYAKPAIPKLQKLLTDSRPTVRLAASRALNSIRTAIHWRQLKDKP